MALMDIHSDGKWFSDTSGAVDGAGGIVVEELCHISEHLKNVNQESKRCCQEKGIKLGTIGVILSLFHKFGAHTARQQKKARETAQKKTLHLYLVRCHCSERQNTL